MNNENYERKLVITLDCYKTVRNYDLEIANTESSNSHYDTKVYKLYAGVVSWVLISFEKIVFLHR